MKVKKLLTQFPRYRRKELGKLKVNPSLTIFMKLNNFISLN
jgi:hypothetical protein